MIRCLVNSKSTRRHLLSGVTAFLILLTFAFGLGERSYGQFTPETLLVAHELADGSTAISRLSLGGVLLQRYGTLTPAPGTSNEFRAHLAVSGGFLFRSNGVVLNTISEFGPDGTLKATITPNTSQQHSIVPIARDFANSTIYMVDTFAGTNVVRHLDLSTGAGNGFVTLQYTGIAGITDLYFGGPARSEALYALTATSPQIVSGARNRVAKIESTGAVQFFDNPELIVPFVFDVGSLAVAPIDGSIYVATTTKIVKLDASGAPLGSFALVDEKPSLDVDVDGHIYVGHFSSSIGEIDVFLPTGRLIKTISVPGATRIIDILIVRPPMQ